MNTLQQLGTLVDDRLERMGLCLTQGGEPTFVPHNSQSPEWSIAALGPEKLPLARRLARRLTDSLYPGAVAICTAGKLYSGEPEPRWALSILFAGANRPLWRHPERLQWAPPGAVTATPAHAQRLMELLARSLGLSAKPVTAFEDVTERMRLEERDGRAGLLPRFSPRLRQFIPQSDWTEEDLKKWTGYCEPAGWVLPLSWSEDRWVSPRWEWPGDPDLTLVPGKSPIGLRLPLNQIHSSGAKCALTTEVRAGDLSVFIPPLPEFESLARLLAALESIMLEHPDLPPVVLDGYVPPLLPEHTVLSLTADPGVLEINIPPCKRFSVLHNLVLELYQAAEDCGLRGFKCAPNGRPVPTGGGAHILLGGPSLSGNPFVQCPSLLASFIRFTQNHPSLSYFFTGQFVGPSSQATRLDESLPDALSELDLALRSLEAMPAPGDADQIDRILRNLLVDWHGNPHRSAICLDKFFYPYAPNGQMGLVEFRAVEMPPAADQLLAIHLFYRALAAVFAEQPYREPLLSWGDALHDRFLLPWHLEHDFRSVLTFLRQRGFALDWDPFQRLLDFRCPQITRWQIQNVPFEIRQAMEPWPVMGMQPGPSGLTTRPVDASTDRLQILCHASAKALPVQLLCNGWPVPLQPAPAPDNSAVSLCGLRYRRFNNSLGLQPQIHAHAPLTFDVIDPATLRILKSFLYQEHGQRPSLTEQDKGTHVSSGIVPLAKREGQTATIRPVPTLSGLRYTFDLRQVQV